MNAIAGNKRTCCSLLSSLLPLSAAMCHRVWRGRGLGGSSVEARAWKGWVAEEEEEEEEGRMRMRRPLDGFLGHFGAKHRRG